MQYNKDVTFVIIYLLFNEKDAVILHLTLIPTH